MQCTDEFFCVLLSSVLVCKKIADDHKNRPELYVAKKAVVGYIVSGGLVYIDTTLCTLLCYVICVHAAPIHSIGCLNFADKFPTFWADEGSHI